MDVAPVFTIPVFKQGEELQKRCKSIVVFQAIILSHFLDQFDIFLVQDTPVFISDFGGSPFDIRAFQSGGLSPSGAADRMPETSTPVVRRRRPHSARDGNG